MTTTPTSQPTPPPSPCDNASVGVLITNPEGRLLLIERANPPVGYAPPAGHVYDHPDALYATPGTAFLLAALAEVTEETGLTVEPGSLRIVLDRWADNRCRRPVLDKPGHQWRVYTATAYSGDVTATDEARSHSWVTRAELAVLANRTVRYAAGEISHAEYRDKPGLEPIWVWWLRNLGWLPVVGDPDALAAYRLATGEITGGVA